MIPIFKLNTDEGRQGYQACVARLKDTVNMTGPAADTVAKVIADVRAEGDQALVRYMRKWTDVAFEASRIRVTAQELENAAAAMPSDIKAAVQRSIARIQHYQQHIMPTSPETIHHDGADLGMRFTPVDSAGLYVPGGTAVLLSTLMMIAVPALVAGVPAEELAVVCPPPTRQGNEAVADISPLVLGTAHLLGLKNVYRIGGAQAIAALAYGTETVKPVVQIVGPGNVFVQLAKAMVSGAVGTEGGFYGPSEIVVVADETADASAIAADLLAQAEHNPGKCFLVTWQENVAQDIVAQMKAQVATLPRQDVIHKALLEESCIVMVDNPQQAADIANELAGEHVTLAVADEEKWIKQVRHGGELFVGNQTPVAAGDYVAGPSHCLPTGTTGRFASGLSVYTFLKRTGVVGYKQLPAEIAADIALLARAEGLEAHARSAEKRVK